MLETYRSLETRVGKLMHGICGPFCGVCKTPCCRADICRESFESPFLLEVHGGKQAFDQKSGYLGPTGCKLANGRPPLCHAFVCHVIVRNQPSDDHRYALDCLGELIGFIQSKAWRNRQLLEAMNETDLLEMDKAVYDARLATAEAAFGVLETFFTRNGQLGSRELEVLSRIKPHLPARAPR